MSETKTPRHHFTTYIYVFERAERAYFTTARDNHSEALAKRLLETIRESSEALPIASGLTIVKADLPRFDNLIFLGPDFDRFDCEAKRNSGYRQ